MYSGAHTEEISWRYRTGGKAGTVIDHYKAPNRWKPGVGSATATHCGHEDTQHADSHRAPGRTV